MAKNGSLIKTYDSGNISFTVAWTLTSQSPSDNQSTIDWEYSVSVVDTSKLDSGQIYLTGLGSTGNSVTFEGKKVWTLSGSKTIQLLQDNTKYVIASGTTTVNHNLDGTKTMSYGLELSCIGELTTQKSWSATGELDAIPRHGMMVNAPNFTDEQSPTITYTCLAGSAATSLQAAISFTGSTDDIKYRDIPKGSGGTTQLTYTFNFTTAEKNTLYAKLNAGSYSTTVRFYIKTVINGTTSWDYVTRTLTFVNYTPTISPTVYDTNSKTLALTGNKNKLIRYMSDAYFSMNAQARKGATIDTQFARNGDVTITDQQTGTFTGVTSNTFYYSVTDSRGDTTNDFNVFNIDNGYFIEYVKLTCNLTTETLTAEGNLNVLITGKYYAGSFGAASNSLSLRYGLNKENQGMQWYDVGTITPTVNTTNNTYEYRFTISGMDYLSIYQLTVEVQDKLMPKASSATTVIAAQPIFDWSKNDFQFYVPVTFNAGYQLGSDFPKVLWEGASHMNGNQTASLSDSIQNQATGIILIFSLYRNGAAEDVSITSFFISKKEVELMPGGKHTFLMAINNNLSVFGSKYLSINNWIIGGDASNTSSGTAAGSGITFDNSQFVLRYVLGV